MQSLTRRLLTIIAALLVAACGSGSGGTSNSGAAIPPVAAAPVVPAVADINLLFMGNSHTTVHDVPGMVGAMVRAGKSNKTVSSVEAPNWMFLEQRATDPSSLALLKSRKWTAVILQAQEYSSSGQFFYPTTGAEALVRMSREQSAVPVMFPEWSRRGIAETQRIFDLHVSIARKEAACVAPIPQAWDLALARYPSMVLHDADGNHSATAGAFLAALVIYATVTGLSPQDLPALPFDVDADTQMKLRGIASETVLNIPPRMYCPNDAPG
ncbi:MAG: hypothetical protein ABI905_06890 [Betaproteobacteria bacterium]